MKDTFSAAQLIVMPLVLNAIIESLDSQTAGQALKALRQKALSATEGGRGPELNKATFDLYQEYVQRLEAARKAARS